MHPYFRPIPILSMAALVAILSGCSASARHSPDSPDAFPAAERNALPPTASAELLQRFDAPVEERYRLGLGDRIFVDVWGLPELTGPHVVGPDGNITVPVAGQIPVADLTREDAAAAIETRLGGYYKSAAVTLRVDEYVANRVLVLGRVAHPGAISFSGPPTLLDVISRAGGLPVGDVGQEESSLSRCAVFRGRDRVLWVDLRALLRGTDLASNIRLQRDDVVYIPDADTELVYVLGEVATPGAYPLTPDMSFIEALARAGGPTRDAAPDRIEVVRPRDAKQVQVRLADLRAARARHNLALQDGDIIYVPENGVATVGYVLEKLAPITQMLLIGAALGG